jgi:formylmethanofuran dehydrogenase subunit B
MGFEQQASLFIPAGVPGIDHPGHWYRSDSVCPLPLRQLRESRLPSVAQIVSRLFEYLQLLENEKKG